MGLSDQDLAGTDIEKEVKRENDLNLGLLTLMLILKMKLSEKLTSTLALKEMLNEIYIMRTRPYDLYTLAPHFYKIKLVFTGVYIFFLFFVLKLRSWVLV